MRRLILIALLACCCCGMRATAQEWIKAYGGPTGEYAYNIYPTADGGFFTAGTQTVAANEDHFWIARFDSSGAKLWDKRYGDAGVTYTLFGSTETRDGGLMFGGFTNQQFSGREAAVMYRIDSTGKQLWFDSVDYSSSDHFHFFVERKEGGYYFGGHTDSKADPNGNMWLQRLDSNRRVIWEKEYDHGSVEHAHWGIETRDGGALLLGHADVNNTEKFWLVKVDSNGTKQWDKIYSSGTGYDDSPYRVFETKEGNYALIGGSSSSTQQGLSRVWMVVVDSIGGVVIDKHFGDPSSDSFAWSGRQTSDGGYIMAGTTTYKSKGQDDIYIIKTKPDGSLDWDGTYGGTGSDESFDVIETSDGYIATGFSDSPSIMTGGGGDMVLVKIHKAITTAPLAAVLISPPDGSTGVQSDPTLTWRAAATATTYQIQIASDSLFANRVIDDPTLITTSMHTSIPTNHRYWWRVRAMNTVGWGPWSDVWSFVEGTVSAVAGGDRISGIDLSDNAPNPFSGATTIHFSIGTGARVAMNVFDLLGRRAASVVDQRFTPGAHDIRFDGSALAPGTYLYRMTVTRDDGSREERSLRMTVVR